jgi:hypothetical protein
MLVVERQSEKENMLTPILAMAATALYLVAGFLVCAAWSRVAESLAIHGWRGIVIFRKRE